MSFHADSRRNRGGIQRDSNATPPRPDPTRRETGRGEHLPSLTDVSARFQGGGAFTFTPIPPNASPAVELAVWWYDNLRREEEGLL
jgi:hypothetical protein